MSEVEKLNSSSVAGVQTSPDGLTEAQHSAGWSETSSPEKDAQLLRRGDVIAMLRRLGENHADLALFGEEANVRQRESMEAAFTHARMAVALMPPAGSEIDHSDLIARLEEEAAGVLDQTTAGDLLREAAAALSSEVPRVSPSEASAGNLPPDEPNYKALYTDLKREVLEKVGPFAEAAKFVKPDLHDSFPLYNMDTGEGWDLELQAGDFRALSTLYDKLSSIEEASVAESAASVARDLTAGEVQRKSDWRTIDSAPRDGTDLLLYGRCEHDGRAYAADRNVGWCCEESPTGWMGRDLPIRPTHWMPLPPPPNPSARGEL